MPSSPRAPHHLRRRLLQCVLLLPLLAAQPACSEPARTDLGIRRSLGLECKLTGTQGFERLVVTRLWRGGLAESMGLQVGDHLLVMNNRSLPTPEALRQALKEAPSQGENLKIRVFRPIIGEVTLSAALPDPPTLPSYVVKEDVGIEGVAKIGDTQAMMQAHLGQPSKVEDETDSFRFSRSGTEWEYPRFGLRVLMSHERKPRCAGLQFTWPFVGQTQLGLPTDGTLEEAIRIYGKPEEDSPLGSNGRLVKFHGGRMRLFCLRSTGEIRSLLIVAPDTTPKAETAERTALANMSDIYGPYNEWATKYIKEVEAVVIQPGKLDDPTVRKFQQAFREIPIRAHQLPSAKYLRKALEAMAPPHGMRPDLGTVILMLHKAQECLRWGK